MALYKKTVINNYTNNFDNKNFENILLLQGKILSEMNISKISDGKDSRNIQEYEFKVFSQNGEDGIIQYLINKIDIKNKIFIEFGVEDYTEANTRFLLVNNNWSGLIIDGDKEGMELIKKRDIAWRHDLRIVGEFITKDNINDLILSNGINGEIGILSVDVDGNDYWILDSIDCVSPQILICEYNSVFGKNKKITVPYEESFNRPEKHFSNLYWGASIRAFTELANSKGYDLVGSNSFGNNLFFVRHDCNTLGINLNSQEAYVKSKYRESRNKEGELSFISSHDEGVKLIGDMEVLDLEKNEIVKIKELNL